MTVATTLFTRNTANPVEINRRLLHSCHAGNMRQVSELLEKGADMAHTDAHGFGPMPAALYNNHFHIVDLLLCHIMMVDRQHPLTPRQQGRNLLARLIELPLRNELQNKPELNRRLMFFAVRDDLKCVLRFLKKYRLHDDDSLAALYLKDDNPYAVVFPEDYATLPARVRLSLRPNHMKPKDVVRYKKENKNKSPSPFTRSDHHTHRSPIR